MGILKELFPVSIPGRWKSRDGALDTRKSSQIEEPSKSLIKSLNGAVGLNEETCKPLAEVAITRVSSVCDLGEEFKGLRQDASQTCVVRCIQLHKAHDEVLRDWVGFVGDGCNDLRLSSVSPELEVGIRSHLAYTPGVTTTSANGPEVFRV